MKPPLLLLLWRYWRARRRLEEIRRRPAAISYGATVTVERSLPVEWENQT